MTQILTKLEKKSFNNPDVTQTPPYMKLESVNFGDLRLDRVTFQPGWRWSAQLKPLAGTESCQQAHCTYVISGHLRIQTDDGEVLDAGPGDVFITPAGHDAWVLGDEPCMALDLEGAIRGA